MGTYRFLLALCVMLSHLGFSVGGHNPGVASVVGFYVISGYVMTALIRKYYATPSRFGLFMLDRSMRLYPQFLVYLGLQTLSVWLLRPPIHELSDLTINKFLLNLLMIPVNFYQIDWLGLGTCALMPWSLGLELLFYLVIPFILIFEVRFIFFALSLLVFLAAYLGFLNTDLFGYRFLPGTLFMFLCGSLLRDFKHPVSRRVLGVMLGILPLGLWGIHVHPGLNLPYNVEVLWGLWLAIPLVYWLGRKKSGDLDTWLGNLSYGVFLNHPVLLFASLGLGIDVHEPLNAMVFIGTSILMSWISYRCVERPIVDLRHKLTRVPVLPISRKPMSLQT
jgi:peptidoglycan/LPS O-acetylase OafA/YrhL